MMLYIIGKATKFWNKKYCIKLSEILEGMSSVFPILQKKWKQKQKLYVLGLK